MRASLALQALGLLEVGRCNGILSAMHSRYIEISRYIVSLGCMQVRHAELFLRRNLGSE